MSRQSSRGWTLQATVEGSTLAVVAVVGGLLAGAVYSLVITVPALVNDPSEEGGHGSIGAVVVALILGSGIGLILGAVVGLVCALAIMLLSLTALSRRVRLLIAAMLGAVCSALLFGTLGGWGNGRTIAESVVLGALVLGILYMAGRIVISKSP